MKVNYGEGTREPAEQFRRLENATAELERAIGPQAADVTAEWERDGRPRSARGIRFGSRTRPGKRPPRSRLTSSRGCHTCSPGCT